MGEAAPHPLSAVWPTPLPAPRLQLVIRQTPVPTPLVLTF